MAQRVGEILNEKVIPPILKFVNTRPITALKNGMLVVMPLTIVGAIFLLIGNFPIEAFVNWLDAVGIRDSILSVYVATFNMLGMVACFAITYNYVKHAGYEPIPAAVWGMCTMVLLMPHDLTDPDSGVTIGNIISLDWTGSKGMIESIPHCLLHRRRLLLLPQEGHHDQDASRCSRTSRLHSPHSFPELLCSAAPPSSSVCSIGSARQ